MSTELARRFAHHQGYSKSGAVQAPTFTDMIARGMQAVSDGDMTPGEFSRMLDSIAAYRDDANWARISMRERALLMAEGMRFRSQLVAIEQRKVRR